jgi:hypothetical protein
MSKPATATDGTQGNTTHQPRQVPQVMVSSTFRFFDIWAMQDWAQKRHKPKRSAQVPLTVIAREPETVSKCVVEVKARLMFY